MKTFRIHLKGSNQPVIVPGDEAVYTKKFLNIKTRGKITSQYIRADTQGYSAEEPTSSRRKNIERIA